MQEPLSLSEENAPDNRQFQEAMASLKSTTLSSFRQRLITLGGRNRALWLSRPTQKRDFDMGTPDLGLTPALIYARLEELLNGKTIKLVEGNSDRFSGENKCVTRLKNLRKNAQFIENETGSWELQLGFPYVLGRLSDETYIHSPLFLLPVKIENKDNKWTLSVYEDSDAEINRALLLKNALHENKTVSEDLLQLTIADLFEEGEKITLQDLYLRSHQKLKEYLYIGINSGEFQEHIIPYQEMTKEEAEQRITSANLKFTKECLLTIIPNSGGYLDRDYQELIDTYGKVHVQEVFHHPNSGDNAGGPLITPTAGSIKGSQEKSLAEKAAAIPEHDILLPLVTDSSQEEVLRRIKTGQSLQIQGPPGTGKSQLIANAVADAIFHGKKVLVVCQKRAALDVVYERMKDTGLEDALVLIHDIEKDKAPFSRSLVVLIDKVREHFANQSVWQSNFDKGSQDWQMLNEGITQLLYQLSSQMNLLEQESDFGIAIRLLYLQAHYEPLNKLDPYSALFTGWNQAILAKKSSDYRLLFNTVATIKVPFWQQRIPTNQWELDDKALAKVLESIEMGYSGHWKSWLFEERILAKALDDWAVMFDWLAQAEPDSLLFQVAVQPQLIDTTLLVISKATGFLNTEKQPALTADQLQNLRNQLVAWQTKRNTPIGSIYSATQLTENLERIALWQSRLTHAADGQIWLQSLSHAALWKEQVPKIQTLVSEIERLGAEPAPEALVAQMQADYAQLVKWNDRIFYRLFQSFMRAYKDMEDRYQSYAGVNLKQPATLKYLLEISSQYWAQYRKLLGDCASMGLALSVDLRISQINQDAAQTLRKLIQASKESESLLTDSGLHYKHFQRQVGATDPAAVLRHILNFCQTEWQLHQGITTAFHTLSYEGTWEWDADAALGFIDNQISIWHEQSQLLNALMDLPHNEHKAFGGHLFAGQSQETVRVWNQKLFALQILLSQYKADWQEALNLTPNNHNPGTVLQEEWQRIAALQTRLKHFSEPQIRSLTDHLAGGNSLKPWIHALNDGYPSMQLVDGQLASWTPEERDLFQTLISLWKDLVHDIPAIDKVINTFQSEVYRQWLLVLEERYPSLKTISNLTIISLEKRLQELLILKHEQSKRRCKTKMTLNQLQGYELNTHGNPKTFATLRNKTDRKKRFVAIRQLLSEFYDEILRLKPVWLLSPESVSQLFPMKAQLFDMVLFDEASQCFPEMGLPAIFRAKQVVVVGDSQQLRPSSLFAQRVDGSDPDGNQDEDNGVNTAISLLDMVSVMDHFGTGRLEQHYRSRRPELIDFSNRHFYENRLQLLPEKQAMATTDSALQFVKVEGAVWHERLNEKEGQALISFLISQLRKAPDYSYGVVTFNDAQKEYIDEQLDIALAERIIERPASLFVKNIENVQGDERDIILFSVGYAYDSQGKFNRNFGSLSTEGGENRLNVAVSRAKHAIYLFASIEPNVLKAANLSKGAQLLQAYLEYANQLTQNGIDSILTQRTAKNRLAPEHDVKLVSLIQALHPTWQVFIPSADLTKVTQGKCEALAFTDDYLAYQYQPKDFHGYLPIAMDKKGWPYYKLYSRDYWRTEGRVLEEL